MEQKTKTEKRSYGAPHITVLGDIETITLGTQTGNFTDAAFPQNTFFKDLTFS